MVSLNKRLLLCLLVFLLSACVARTAPKESKLPLVKVAVEKGKVLDSPPDLLKKKAEEKKEEGTDKEYKNRIGE
ncbi:MAG: hypothetical protein ACE5GM_05075, partial [bacterium]